MSIRDHPDADEGNMKAISSHERHSADSACRIYDTTWRDFRLDDSSDRNARPFQRPGAPCFPFAR
jgi:hypothetical protein